MLDLVDEDGATSDRLRSELARALRTLAELKPLAEAIVQSVERVLAAERERPAVATPDELAAVARAID